MFKNPLFEALSKVPYYVPLIVYVPVIGYFFWTSVSANGLLMFLLHLVMGLFVWTLAYVEMQLCHFFMDILQIYLT